MRHKHGDGALPVLGKLLDNEDTTVILHAARTIELLGERARPLKPVMQSLAERYKDKPGDPAWFIRFTDERLFVTIEMRKSSRVRVARHVAGRKDAG